MDFLDLKSIIHGFVMACQNPYDYRFFRDFQSKSVWFMDLGIFL